MKSLRSYNGHVLVAWLFSISFVSTMRDLSFFDTWSLIGITTDEYVILGVSLGVIVVALSLVARMKRRAEHKVRQADPILLTDIQILAKADSSLLEEALDLRNAQRAQGDRAGD